MSVLDRGGVYLNKIKSIRTDFGEGDSYQKVVQFNYDGSLMITGGCDGVLRIWKVHTCVHTVCVFEVKREYLHS